MARYFIRKQIMTVAVGLGLAASVGFASPDSLTQEQARELAWRALQTNKPHVTLQLADQLIERQPEAFEPAYLRAEALRRMRRNDQAVAAAKVAFQKAVSRNHKYDAAHSVAKSHFANGSKGYAQMWLRRAEQNAPDEKARSRVVRDFQHVRRSKPMKTRLNFSIVPTSNINNGSTNDQIMINGIPFRVPSSGQPHSGTGITVGFHTTYRKPLKDGVTLRFGVKGTTTQYVLSKEAKALGSGLTGSDFAYAAFELQAGITRFNPKFKGTGFGATRFDVALGRSWYGGNSLSNYGRISVGQDYGFSPRALARAKVGIERQQRLDSGISSATIKSFDLDMIHRFKDKSRLTYGVTLRDTNSESNTVESDVIAARVSYTMAPMQMDITPTFSLNIDRTDYSRLSIGGVQRVDDRISASVSVFFPKVSYYGFAPTVNVTASQKSSTIDIYSNKTLSMNIGFQSAF